MKLVPQPQFCMYLSWYSSVLVRKYNDQGNLWRSLFWFMVWALEEYEEHGSMRRRLKDHIVNL